MKWKEKLAVVATVVLCGTGCLMASGASAGMTLSPASTAYSGASVGAVVMTFDTATVTCDGTVAGNTGAASTGEMPFTPGFGNCDLNLGGIVLPVTVTIASDWRVTGTSGSVSPITGDLDIESPGSGHAVTIDIPQIGCEIYIDGRSNLQHVVLENVWPTGVGIAVNVGGVIWGRNFGCPILPPLGTNGTIVGTLRASGITLI